MATERKTALVVGDGIVGLACAHRLGREGFSVTVLHAEDGVMPASWGNAGHIAVEQVEPLASFDTFKKALQLFIKGGGPIGAPAGEFRSWLPFFLRMARASGGKRFRLGTAALTACMAQAIPAWRRLLSEAGDPDLLLEQGHYVVWESVRTATAGKANWDRANTGATSWRDATAGEFAKLQSLLSTRLHGAIRFEGTGQMRDTARLLEAIRQSIAGAGGNFVSRRVRAVECTAGGALLVADDDSNHEADIIVIAAGVDSGRLLRQTGAVAPIIAERGYHIQSPPDAWPEGLPPVVFEDRAMVVTGFQSALRATSFVEFARHDRPATVARWERLERHVDELGLPFARPRSRWIGARPTLPDYLPAIGRSARAENLLYAFGHQHLGLTMAAVTGEMIVELACGRRPAVDVAPFDLSRFRGKI